MLKVLHVYKNYHPVAGGIEGHIRLLCSELAKSGFDVSVLATNTTKITTKEVLDGVKVVKAGPDLTLARTPISWRLWLEISRTRADLTHLHFPYPFGELGHLLFGKTKNLVVTYHSDIVNQRRLLKLYEPFLWKVLQRADRIIATTPKYVESSPYLKRFEDKCAVVPFGIDVSRFQRAPEPATSETRRRYGAPLLLFVGKFRYYKGLQYLIEAMKQIPARLLLVGEGPLEASLRSLVRERGLEDKVCFVGEVGDDELVAFYHACDVFVLPASHRSEAFGIVQLEAMACGKPVICTEVGTGTSWVNVHKETGLVVEPANVQALVGAVNLLLDDARLRQRLGDNARGRARREFSKELMVKRIADIYRDLWRS